MINARRSSGHLRCPEVFGRGEAQRDDAPRMKAGGALAEKFPCVEAIGLAGGRLRHGHQNQVPGKPLVFQILPGVGPGHADGRIRQRRPDLLREITPEKVDRVKIEKDGIDPDRPVPEKFAEGAVPSSAQDEDPPRLRVLQCRDMGEELRFSSSAFEGQRVVHKDGYLPGEDRRGDSSVKGILCDEKPRVVPARHPAVDGGRLMEDSD